MNAPVAIEIEPVEGARPHRHPFTAADLPGIGRDHAAELERIEDRMRTDFATVANAVGGPRGHRPGGRLRPDVFIAVVAGAMRGALADLIRDQGETPAAADLEATRALIRTLKGRL